jgi:spermidine synthase
MRNAQRPPNGVPLFIFVLFGLSGFAGIIYESIWSHYLKLFLGHAAYAQSVVLVMFMGGMAAGAWLAARVSRQYDLLKIYIAIELIIGIGGFIFHDLYITTTGLAYREILPNLSSPEFVELAKHSLAGLLILPQSALLGMTFPLMTVGVLRRNGGAQGETLASLYFVNSLGAALGVLISGFILVYLYGLPGTLRFAASINIAIAIVLALALRFFPPNRQAPAQQNSQQDIRYAPSLLLLVALATGAASFIYEIVWIRMLNMVLGASTHSFELMLSAFILGLAIGSYWIRRRIAQIKHPLAVLGFIQVAMAVFALATLMFYDFSFVLMSITLLTLAASELGYFAFLFFSHAIALLIMLPVTICAGMTLPLVTRALIDRGYGDRSVGNVYACNTIGAIVGVVAAVHFLIPRLNLESALIGGALIDLAVGCWLLVRFVPGRDRRALPIVIAMALSFALFTAMFVQIDPRKMASGVYRSGIGDIEPDAEVALRRDGKTSTVTVVRADETRIILATNGKPDASMEFDPSKPFAIDETTQVLAGVIPILAAPQAKTAAIIGMGSGMTTHALLASPILERVDTIEIESAMVEGARHFLPAVQRTFDDPRSRIIINDARTYFSTEKERYDLIISEPSNPWVSGVAGLFSSEFYHLVEQHLSDDGVFIQWVQLYEIDLNLVSSIFKAIDGVFDEFVVYEGDDGNILIVAGDSGVISEHAEQVFQMPNFPALLSRIDIHTPADLRLRRLGGNSFLMPLFNSYPLPANSDFFPVLDQGSASRRFRGSSATELLDLLHPQTPIRDIFEDSSAQYAGLTITKNAPSKSAQAFSDARSIYRWVINKEDSAARFLNDRLRHLTSYGLQYARSCSATNADFFARNLTGLVAHVISHLSADEAQELIERLAPSQCNIERNDVTLLRALARRDSPAIVAAARTLRFSNGSEKLNLSLLVEAEIFGYLLVDDRAAVLVLWQTLSGPQRDELARDVAIRLMVAHAGWTGFKS